MPTTFQLRPEYAGVGVFTGGRLAVDEARTAYDVKAALTAGAGIITVADNDEALLARLAIYPALVKVGSTQGVGNGHTGPARRLTPSVIVTDPPQDSVVGFNRDGTFSLRPPRAYVPRLALGGVPICGRCWHPNSGAVSVAGEKHNSAHIFRARFGTAGVRLVFAAYYAGSSVDTEAPTPNGITVRATIEHPIGNANRTTFTGQGRKAFTFDGGALYVCDVATPSIPAGAQFKVTTFADPGAGGQLPLGTNGLANLIAGDGLEHGAAVADKTQTGAIAAAAENTFGPVAVLGFPKLPVPIVGLVGDSITAGVGDAQDDVNGEHWGFLERAFKDFARVNIARAGDYVINHPNNRLRRRLVEGCTHIVEAAGANDVVLNGNFGLSTFGKTSKLQAWRDLGVGGAKVFTTVTTPRPNPGANDANTRLARIDLTSWLRDGAPTVNAVAVAVGTQGATVTRAPVYGLGGALVNLGSALPHSHLEGIFDVALAVETAIDSNLWIPGKDAGDATHPSPAGAADMAACIPLEPFAI